MKPTPQESLDALATLSATVPADQAVIELGVHRGATALAMARATLAHVWGIDLWDMRIGTSKLDRKRKRRGFTDAEVFAEVKAAAAEVPNLTLVKAATAEAARLWRGPIGLLHIDAAHDFVSVRQDYDAWAPFVASGGWIAFDDAQPGRDVARAIDDVVLPSGWWEPSEGLVAGRLFIARRR